MKSVLDKGYSLAKIATKNLFVRNVARTPGNWLHFGVFEKNMCIAEKSTMPKHRNEKKIILLEI